MQAHAARRINHPGLSGAGNMVQAADLSARSNAASQKVVSCEFSLWFVWYCPVVGGRRCGFK